MKVLTRAEFMKMPEGTIFAKGKPWCFEDLSVKGQTLPSDFIYLSLVTVESDSADEWSSRLNEMLETGCSYPIDESGFTRDGCFDEGDLFLVYEKSDLLMLRSHIDEALRVC